MKRVNPSEVRILVVDDDPDILNGTARLLENAGYAVGRAATGEEALQAVRDRRPDLLLLDRDLPGIDGLEVCRRIKQDPAQADIFVVMISASYTKSEEQAEGLESGADGYIARPIANRELLARVDAYVRILSLTRALRLQAEELKQSNKAAGQAQLASLNLMEDAVAARTRLETTNEELRREIMERERAEVARREGEKLYRSLFENMLNGFAYCRMIFEQGQPPDFVYLAVNGAFEKLTGLKDVAGRKVSEVVPGIQETDPGLLEMYGRVARTGVPERFEIYVEALKEWFDIAVYCPQPDHFVAVFDVITKRKQTEESQARLATAVEQAAETTVITDPNGTILYANPAFEKTSGYTCAEVLGQNPRILKSGKHDAEFYRAMWAVLGRGEVWTGRLINQKKDGTLYEEVASISPVRDPAGKVVNYVAVKRDVTHETLLEAQLRQSQKMEAVGQLAGGVAHDFNNMLAVIRGNAELLLMTEDSHTPATMEGLKQVVDASERAATLTRQLLAFSRKQVLQPQPLLLSEVITNLTRMLERIIGENIDLQCHHAPSLPHVQADTGMMEQVILNLVVNARDAMPEGGRLRVATELLTLDEAYARANPEARAGDFVCLTVNDTGTGIAPEVLPRIFEPFFTTKEVGQGTGLGLATVYGIVTQHHGWVEVSSRVGAGSTFKILLPTIPTPARLSAAPEGGEAMRGGNETILLVEDDHAVRATTRRVLERAGYAIREATSAREALEQWRRHAGEIALLLADIIMPGDMSGRSLAEQLWAERPELRVIFMSGYSADVLGKNTEFTGRTRSRFLQKPSSSRTLLETVRQCLDQKEPMDPSSAPINP